MRLSRQTILPDKFCRYFLPVTVNFLCRLAGNVPRASPHQHQRHKIYVMYITKSKKE